MNVGSLNGKKKAELVKSLHEKVKLQIEIKSKLVVSQANKDRKCVTFERLGLGTFQEGAFSEAKEVEIAATRRWSDPSYREDQGQRLQTRSSR